MDDNRANYIRAVIMARCGDVTTPPISPSWRKAHRRWKLFHRKSWTRCTICSEAIDAVRIRLDDRAGAHSRPH